MPEKVSCVELHPKTILLSVRLILPIGRRRRFFMGASHSRDVRVTPQDRAILEYVKMYILQQA